MKIVCHAGPWSDTYLKYVTKGIAPDATCVITSAHKKVDETGISTRYYDFLKINKNKDYKINEQDNDIILRCRLLRALDLKTALLHLNSMRDAIIEMFDTYKPDLLLSETIDAYVMDIMYFECHKRRIPFVGLVSVFINGYVRISARGEFNFVREPKNEEVEASLKMLEDRAYLPAFINAKANPVKAIFTRWFRNVIKVPYFKVKRITSGEKYNYHYWQNIYVSGDWLHAWPRLNLGTESWKKELSESKKRIIYLPLQFVPEATVDYWCQSLDVIDYNKTLLELLDNYKDDFHFLIKEHPNVLGFRNPKLYNQLSERKNVTICPTDIPSNELVNSYDAVLVWTGTVGFECALRSRPVLTLATPYYWEGNNFLLIEKKTKPGIINDFIDQFPRETSKEEKLKMVKHVLSGVVPGVLKVDGSWTATNPTHVKEALELGKNIGPYCLEKIQELKS